MSFMNELQEIWSVLNPEYPEWDEAVEAVRRSNDYVRQWVLQSVHNGVSTQHAGRFIMEHRVELIDDVLTMDGVRTVSLNLSICNYY
jgi:hypothetical protein